jgi:hypothetical protein
VPLLYGHPLRYSYNEEMLFMRNKILEKLFFHILRGATDYDVQRSGHKKFNLCLIIQQTLAVLDI